MMIFFRVISGPCCGAYRWLHLPVPSMTESASAIRSSSSPISLLSLCLLRGFDFHTYDFSNIAGSNFRSVHLVKLSLCLFSFDSFSTLLLQLWRPLIHSGRGDILAHLNCCFCFCGGCQKLGLRVLDHKIQDLFLHCLRHPRRFPASSAQGPTSFSSPSWRSHSSRSQTCCRCCWLSIFATTLASIYPPCHIAWIWYRLTNNSESPPCTFFYSPISFHHLIQNHLSQMDHDSVHISYRIPSFLVVDFVKHEHFHSCGRCRLSL